MDRRGAAGGTAGQKVRRRMPYKPFASVAPVLLPKRREVEQRKVGRCKERSTQPPVA